MEAMDGPVTRSRTKEYVHRRFTDKHAGEPRIRLKYDDHGHLVHQDSQNTEDRRSLFASPSRLGQSLVTPMKAFARGVTNSMNNIPLFRKSKRSKVDYEVVTNAF
jgi:hypothetical protein